MKKLLLMLLAGAASYAQNFNNPPDMQMCENNTDGFGTFDLTMNNAAILDGENPNDYTISYHATQADATAGLSTLPIFYMNVTAFQQEIYARVTDNESGDAAAILNFALIVNPSPSFNLPHRNFCVDYITGEVLIPAVLNTQLSTDGHDFIWYLNGIMIPGNEPSLNATIAGQYSVFVTNSVTGCNATASANVAISGPASPVGQGYIINGQNITVNVEGFGEYVYQIDNGPLQQSNVFNNVTLGTHTLTIYDVEGIPFCASLVLNNIEVTIPNAPTGDEEQTFEPGATLASIEIEGENIQWYDGISTDSAMDTQETPLPLTTLLVDGTTYYASQTINGTESEERLAITVHLTMGVNEQNFTGLKYYPNPVANTLNISNNNVIDDVVVYNMIGQVVLNKKIDYKHTQIDLSALNSGMYIVKIDSGGQSKTIKIQKI